MPEQVARSPKGAGVCSNCREWMPVVKWVYSRNEGGSGWYSYPPIALCADCLYEQWEALRDAEFLDVYINRLKNAGLSIPRGSNLAQMREQCREAGLRVDGPSAHDAADLTAEEVRPGSQRWWAEKAAAIGVPLPDGQDWSSRVEIEERIDLWADAQRLGISLMDSMSNQDVREAVQASREARAAAVATGAGAAPSGPPAPNVAADDGNLTNSEGAGADVPRPPAASGRRVVPGRIVPA